MHKHQNFLRRRLASFRFAIQGVAILFRTEFHAWIHLCATIAVIAAAVLFDLTTVEWAILFLAMGFVWTAEALNTAVEITVDIVSPQYSEAAGKAKDVAAGSVLLASVAAAASGFAVFCPYIWSWLAG